MVEKLTWKKLAWELAFLRTLVYSWLDIWLPALVTVGCYSTAAGMASS